MILFAMADIRELADLIERNSNGDGAHATAIPRLFLHRASSVSTPLHTVYEPALCIIAQGQKRGLAGEQIYVYGQGNYLIISVDIPIVAQVTQASPEQPFLSLRIDLDPAAIGALMLESDVER